MPTSQLQIADQCVLGTDAALVEQQGSAQRQSEAGEQGTQRGGEDEFEQRTALLVGWVLWLATGGHYIDAIRQQEGLSIAGRPPWRDRVTARLNVGCACDVASRFGWLYS